MGVLSFHGLVDVTVGGGPCTTPHRFLSGPVSESEIDKYLHLGHRTRHFDGPIRSYRHTHTHIYIYILNVYIYIYIHIYIYTYVCMYVCMYVFMYVCMYVCMCVYIYIYIALMPLWIQAPRTWIHRLHLQLYILGKSGQVWDKHRVWIKQWLYIYIYTWGVCNEEVMFQAHLWLYFLPWKMRHPQHRGRVSTRPEAGHSRRRERRCPRCKKLWRGAMLGHGAMNSHLLMMVWLEIRIKVNAMVIMIYTKKLRISM